MSSRSWVAAVLLLVALPAAASAWTPLPVADDPLVRMPGTQPEDGVSLEAPRRCLNCHDDYDRTVDPGFHWQGSMMSQAARDPIYWAAFTVAAQDSIWAIGRPNATDLCLRCHTPAGWLEGRSDPTNGSALRGADFDGVGCDDCHRAYDPFFEDTFAGTREGAAWTTYWDESGLGTPTAASAAVATRAADRLEAATTTFFNGSPYFDGTYRPVPATYTENGSGQFFMAVDDQKRASFVDADARHTVLYSRHHKSRYFCGTCHDVSNAILANLPFSATTPGTGSTVLRSESDPAYSYFHVERTFSEFLLSDYGRGAGAAGRGFYAPSSFTTSQPGNLIASCQDCHMPDRSGFGCDKAGAVDRPTGSDAHPGSGQPLHDLTGGNYWVPWLLASTEPSSPNYDAMNAMLLDRPAALTMNLAEGEGLNAEALLAGAARSRANLTRAAALEGLALDSSAGTVALRIRNQTGHKLPSGYPEGRRMWLNLRVFTGGTLSFEVNPYARSVGTLVGLPTAESPSSPRATAAQRHDDALVYEAETSSSMTAEAHTFHFALADARYKDNRIPPQGFRIGEAAARLSEPVTAGASAPGLFTPAEYAGGYDDVSVAIPAGADGVEVNLYYQTTSREYVEFLRDEINGAGATLSSPTPSGEPEAYVVATDPFFDGLRAWGDTIWQLWDHNRDVPGAAPVLMASAVVGAIGDPCAPPAVDGDPCNDGDACTAVDSCVSGVCVGASPVTCRAIDQCHRRGSCDPATGLCTTPNRPDGTVCDDGDACTTTDTCQSGSCLGASPVVCRPIDQCHQAGECDVSTGTCTTPPRRDGTLCDMGAGMCVAGACMLTDAGMGDAGLPDSGVSDGGFDAGLPDTGAADGGFDAALPDTGRPDAMVPDAAVDASRDAAVDAVVDASRDAAVDDASDGGSPPPPDAGTDGGTETAGGCQCDAAGASTTSMLPWPLLLVLPLVLRRRRPPRVASSTRELSRPLRPSS